MTRWLPRIALLDLRPDPDPFWADWDSILADEEDE